MKKYIFLSMLLLSAVASNAQEVVPLQPTYLTNVMKTGGWDSNWFVEVKGGASAFLGSPIGCGELFDRTMPVLQVGLGKWFTPTVGGRIAYQGLKFKNANLQKMDYQHVHADFLYNITHNLQQDDNGLSRLDVIPFVGIGIIRNGSTMADYFQAGGTTVGNHPLALSYGIELRYHLADRLHLVGEVSGMTTTRNFDCVGTSCKLGDNMLNVSIGLSYTIGKKGWTRVIDAAPYIQQNNYLLDQYNACRSNNARMQEQDTESHSNKNDYSGLNSLRYRMQLGNNQDGQDAQSAATTNSSDSIAVGVPVYFYFKLNTAKLVDKSQLANLDEIARIAKEQNLTIHISGAADSATGTTDINRELSKARARYIGKQLMKRGITKDHIRAVSLGGISQFTPKEANRFTVVLLSK